MNGVGQMRNGIRLPHRLRYRSLLKLTIGVITMFIAYGMVVTIKPIVALLAPSFSSFSGMMLGATASIRKKTKSPHSSQRKRLVSAALV